MTTQGAGQAVEVKDTRHPNVKQPGVGRGKSLRGFAGMDRDAQRAIASKGGIAAHAKKTAHEWNSEEASAAAKEGHRRKTAHTFTSEEARVAGRKGGLARAASRKAAVLAATTASTPGAVGKVLA